MNRIHFGLMTVLCLLVGAGSARAACPAPPPGSLNLIAPNIPVVQLEHVPAPPPGGSVTLLVPPRHGGLTRQGNTWFYTPLSSFWTLGTDRFLLHLHSPPGEPKLVAVHLQSLASGPVLSSTDFETGGPEGGWLFLGNAEVTGVAPLSGASSLRIVASPGDEGSALKDIGILPGDGSQGSGATGGWRPPPTSGLEGVVPQFGWSEANLLTFFGIDPAPAPLAWVRMRSQAGAVSLRLETPDLVEPAPWHSVSSVPHRLSLAVISDQLGPGSASLWVDGRHLSTVLSTDLTEENATGGAYGFGLSSVAGDPTDSLFDELSILRIRDTSPAIELNCHDDFESASLAPEWGQVGGAALGWKTPGISGEGALVVWPNVGSGGLIAHNGFAALNIRRMGLRMTFDPTLLEMATGSTISIADSANTLATRPFRVFIDRVASGNLRMRVAARHDDPAAPAVVASFPITTAVHTLELDWSRSETEVEGTGYLRVWLDGEEKANLTGLLNSAQIPHEVRFGALTVQGTPSGKLVMDDIDFWYEN